MEEESNGRVLGGCICYAHSLEDNFRNAGSVPDAGNDLESDLLAVRKKRIRDEIAESKIIHSAASARQGSAGPDKTHPTFRLRGGENT